MKTVMAVMVNSVRAFKGDLGSGEIVELVKQWKDGRGNPLVEVRKGKTAVYTDLENIEILNNDGTTNKTNTQDESSKKISHYMLRKRINKRRKESIGKQLRLRK